jgi:flagellin-like protein
MPKHRSKLSILRRNKRALSPVVASIILIAVTVAVSIAVAAWMGALTFSFMSSGEQVQVGTPYGMTNGAYTANVTVSNPGGNAWTITQVRANNSVCTFSWCWYNGTLGTTINAGPVPPQTSITIVITTPFDFYTGYSYTVTIISAKNNEYETTGVCP